MGVRARFWLIAAFLMFTLAICVAVRVDVIQRDLLVRTQDALASAGVAFYGVQILGRDAHLRGFVESREHAERIVDIVAAVQGVRLVADELTIERVSGPPEAVTAQPARLRMQVLGPRFIVVGRLPEAALVDSLLDAAHARFGAANVEADLRVNPQVAAAPWMQQPQLLVELMAAAAGNARLSIQGDRAALFAQVRDAAARVRLTDRTTAIDSLRFDLDVIALDGTTGGAAP